MKNRINKLIFGSVTRELLFIIILCVSVLLLLDINIVSRIMEEGIYGFIADMIKNFIRFTIGSGIVLGIGILILISLENRINKFLFGNKIREILSSILLMFISINFFPNAITILIIIYLLVRRKVAYIVTICDGIKIISEGNLDYKIKTEGYDELAVLSEEINNMSLKLKMKIEEERAAERLKTELITNVSHDLRTPLTSLIGYIQLAANENICTEDKEKYIKISLDKSKKLKVLIDDLFEYSKLESGGIKLDKVKVNVIEIIEQSIGELSVQAKEKNIEFNKNYKNSKIELLIDPSKIGRVFENVLENAVKYSVEKSNININLYEKNEGIIISFENITDSILEEDIKKIFNRFYRTDDSRNSQISGSGLGLAIAKNIVELHGGKIWAEGKENRFILNCYLLSGGFIDANKGYC